MPRAAATTSDSETDRVVAGSTKKKYSTKKAQRTSSDVEEVEEVEKQARSHEESAGEGGGGDEDEEQGEGEEEEEEYEIEKIIEARKGQFVAGRMGYFVKWKNYGDKYNSWVDENDAGNAQELIDQFWAEKKKQKAGPRKSEPVKAKPRPSTEGASSKSLIESSAEPETLPKKRGRPKKNESDAMDVDDEEVAEVKERSKKKPRKSNGLGGKKPESEEEEVFGNMTKYMNTASWEDLIESIDTVERENDGELCVFFTLKKDKKRVKESSRVAAVKFPQKLIMFYESNLRWKTDDPTEVEAD